MPVYRLLNEMPYEELLNWFSYFNTRPIDWRDDQRTYMLLQAQGVKEKPEKLFESLNRLKQQELNEEEERRLARSLVSSGLLAKLQTTAVKNNITWEITENGKDQNADKHQ